MTAICNDSPKEEKITTPFFLLHWGICITYKGSPRKKQMCSSLAIQSIQKSTPTFVTPPEDGKTTQHASPKIVSFPLLDFDGDEKNVAPLHNGKFMLTHISQANKRKTSKIMLLLAFHST